MDYNVLRKVVASCVEGKDIERGFRLNIHKLRRMTKSFGLIPVVTKLEYISKPVTQEDIPLLGEFFKKDALLWFDGKREYTHIIFVREEDMDDELTRLLQDCTQYIVNLEKNAPINKGAKKVFNCSVCPTEYDDNCRCCPNRTINIESVICNIMAKYPCYTAIIAKWTKPDSININIRFRVNPVLMDKDKEQNNTDTPTTDPDVVIPTTYQKGITEYNLI